MVRDFEPVSGVTRAPNVLIVHPSIPAQTVPAFIAYAKANPGKLNMASTGNGTSIHLAGELFNSMTGVELVHVPYRSPPQALTDLIGGQVQVMFDVLAQSLSHIKAGRVRALAVTTMERSASLPDLPTVERICPRLRSQLLGRRLRAQGHARRNRRTAQPGNHRRPRRPQDQERLDSLGSFVMAGSPAQFANSSVTRPKNGASWSARSISRRTDAWVATTLGKRLEDRQGRKLLEGARMLTGIEVLFVAMGGLVVMWIIVIYGSSFFGPK